MRFSIISNSIRRSGTHSIGEFAKIGGQKYAADVRGARRGYIDNVISL